MFVGRHTVTGWTQLIIEHKPDNTHKIFNRNIYGEQIGAWQRLYSTADKPTATDVGALSLYGDVSESLTVGDDLNEITSAGVYQCRFSSDAAKMPNSPTNMAFSLIVVPNSGHGCTQILTEYHFNNRQKIFTRNFYTGDGSPMWGAWQRIFTTANPPTPEEIGAAPAAATRIAYEQQQTQNELNTIAMQQLATQAELNQIEAQQAMTDLELMMMEGKSK